jgi:hypothetical protein
MSASVVVDIDFKEHSNLVFVSRLEFVRRILCQVGLGVQMVMAGSFAFVILIVGHGRSSLGHRFHCHRVL